MPLYEYKCRRCGTAREVRHGFNENFAEPCVECGGEMARVFTPAGIVFKGSGFYVTDSRKSSDAGAGKPAAEKSSGAATPAAGDGSASKPASETSTSTDKASSPAAKSDTPAPKSDSPKSSPKSDAAA